MFVEPRLHVQNRLVEGGLHLVQIGIRPLGGTYELVLEVPPELDLSHLEMVQVMMGNAYWIQQQ